MSDNLKEREAFEAWFRAKSPVGGINAKLAARDAWRAAIEASRAAVPAGMVLAPIELLKRAESSLGSFCSDHGWGDSDMQTMDDISGLLAAAPQLEQAHCQVPAGHVLVSESLLKEAIVAIQTCGDGVDFGAYDRTLIRELSAVLAPQPVAQPGEPLLDCDVAPRPLAYPLKDYHHSPSNGPLHFTWQDKPHRIVYDLIAAVRYYAQAKPEQASQQWMPIETAPKDGTSLMLKAPSGRIADGVFDLKYKVWAWPYVMVEPTHWVPLAGIYKCPQPIREDELVTLYDEAPTSDAEMIEFARAVERYHGIAASPKPKD